MNEDRRPAVLTQRDRSAAADLLTEAFFDNPAHTYIYPDPATRRPLLRWLMYTNLGAQLTVGQGFGERGPDDRLAAMAFWHAPGAPQVSLLQLARFGFLAMPFRQGWSRFARMTAMVEEVETRRLVGLGGRESWYLNNMVVDSAHRGLGIGSRVLRRQLVDVVSPSGRPASLTTQKLENVSFYRRLGFEVVDDGMVGEGAGAFRNWIMIYG